MVGLSAQTDALDFEGLHRAVADVRNKQVFFVGGAPKSGTTWLQLLLHGHPEINCGGEGHFPNRLLPVLSKALQLYNTGIMVKNQSIYEQMKGQPLFTTQHAYYLVTVAISLMLRQPDKANTVGIIGDKTPDNVRSFLLLATLFPRSKFIHIVRDARDCAVSAWFHNLRLNSPQVIKRFASFGEFAGNFAQIWAGNVRLGATFAAENPGRCVTIRYEDLCANPPKILDGLCGFLGASRDPSVLLACCAGADFARLSGGRPRGQEDRHSFFRRGLPGDWRGHFDAPTEQAYRAKAEPWMSNFRYTLTGGDLPPGSQPPRAGGLP